MADHLENAFGIVANAKREVAEMKSRSQRRLTIGTSDTLCRFFLKPYLRRFYFLHPNIQLHITNRTTAETLDLLRRGMVELGFINLPIREPEVDIYPCMEVQDIFVAGKDLLLPPEPLNADDLSRLPLMMESRSNSRHMSMPALFVPARRWHPKSNWTVTN
ncbi:MAG: LysR family transcriptional regulator substrate-binding protein [Christensenellales bacterium]